MNNRFTYAYSAPTPEEREEIKSIRDSYIKKEMTDLEILRKMDRSVRIPPLVLALVLGIAGVLVFGTGLTMVLEWGSTAWGMLVCAAGVLVMGAAYPAHCLVLRRQKKKYAEKIVELSDRLLHGEEGKTDK